MVNRLYEVVRVIDTAKTVTKRTCLDLDKVSAFGESVQRPGKLWVCVGDSDEVYLDISYDEFKKMLEEYHDSKLPTINIPSQWSPPVGNLPEAKLTTTAKGEWSPKEILIPIPEHHREGMAAVRRHADAADAVNILRDAGFAVVLVSPENLKGADPRAVEGALSEYIEDEVDALRPEES